jgi:hypothetical protein
MSATKMIDDKVIKYFRQPSLFSELNLVKSGEIKLHWANWDKLLCKMKKEAMAGDHFTAQEIEQKLEEYETIPIWIINKQGSVESNLRELYTYFLDPRMKELWFELNDETLLSFKSGSGPFIRLQSMRWFDFEVYKTFVFKNLLEKNSLPHRAFRVSVDIPLTCTFKDSIQKDIQANIVQVSKVGLLIKVCGNDIQRFECSDEITYTANLAPFKSAKNKDIELYDEVFKKDIFKKSKSKGTSFKLKKNILNVRNNKGNMIFSNGSEYYLFLHFDDLQECDKKKVKAPLSKVVMMLEEYATNCLLEAA